MDPTFTLRDIVDAYADGEYDLVVELSESLLSWLRFGGFPPKGYARDTARMVVSYYRHRALSEACEVN